MNRPGPPIALVHFWHPDGDEPRPLQAIFAPHTAELHTSVARSRGWLGSNSVQQAEPKPEQDAGVIAFKLWAATGNALVVLAMIPPMFENKDDDKHPIHVDQIAHYNQAIQALRAHRRVRDKRLVIVDRHVNVTVDMLSDGIHPNDRGYMHMASMWFDAIRAHLR